MVISYTFFVGKHDVFFFKGSYHKPIGSIWLVCLPIDLHPGRLTPSFSGSMLIFQGVFDVIGTVGIQGMLGRMCTWHLAPVAMRLAFAASATIKGLQNMAEK